MTPSRFSCRPCGFILMLSAAAGGIFVLQNASDGAALSGVTLLVSAAVALDSLSGMGGEE